jgi:hypothetical protein
MIIKSHQVVVFPDACTAFKLLLASPDLSENMLRILVAFPIVLAPKRLVAGREGAVVRLVVTFHVPDEWQPPIAMFCGKRENEIKGKLKGVSRIARALDYRG